MYYTLRARFHNFECLDGVKMCDAMTAGSEACKWTADSEAKLVHGIRRMYVTVSGRSGDRADGSCRTRNEKERNKRRKIVMKSVEDRM